MFDPEELDANIGTSAATASVGDVADALQRAMVDAVVPEPSEEIYTRAMSGAIMTSVNDVVSATENMTDSQRGSIASALVGAVANFKASKSSLKKIIRNTDESKTADLDAVYGESIKKDFKANWKSINTEAKRIASKIGIEVSGAKETGDKMRLFSTSGHCLRIENMGFDEVQRIIARWYLGCSIDLPTIISLDNQGIVTPFGAYVFRPFQSFQMGSAVVMRSGTDTGFTAVGNSDFILGDNATNKTHLGHFTFYFEPVVTEGNHVMIARDIAFMGYNGGCGVDFFDSWEQAFNESRRTEGHAPSLLAALAFQHESEEKYRHDPISLGGQFADGSILNALDKKGVEHYQTAPFYRQFMGNYNNVDNTTRDAGDDGFYNVEESNFICYQGLQAERGPDKTFSQYTTNTGHLGDSETTDSSLAWSGMLSMKTSVNYHHAENSVSIVGKST